MLQPILEVKAEFNLVLTAVELEIFKQAFFMVVEKLGNLWLAEELGDFSCKLALFMPLSLILFNLFLQ